MATKTIELDGFIQWAKLFEDDRDNGEYDVETNGATCLDLLMDEENHKKFEASGSRKKAKKDEETGLYRVKFKRPWEDKFDRDWAAGPPDIFTPSGDPWLLETDGRIGNDSFGKVYVDIYDTKMGKGSRFKGVQVIKHVPFEKEGGYTIKPKDYTKDSPTKQSTSVPVDTVEDDEIPF